MAVKLVWGLRWWAFICAAFFFFFDVLTFFSILSLSSFRELYPGLAKSLQSVHGVLDSSSPLLPLQLQRVQALLSLLTQVTNTAGCLQELQTSMVRYRSNVTNNNNKKNLKNLIVFFSFVCYLSAHKEKSAPHLLRCPGVTSQGCSHHCWGIWKVLWRILTIHSRGRAACWSYHPI